MKFALRVCVFLLMARASVCADITVTAAEGGEAVINCPYGGGYKTSYKYFYKGQYKDGTLMLKSDGGESPVFNGRFTLKDDHKARLFTVIIRDLQMNDAGEYCCTAGWGDSKSIRLNVIRAPKKPKLVQISTSTIHPNTNSRTDHNSTVTQNESVTMATRTGNTTAEPNEATTSTSQTDLGSVAGGLGSVLLVLLLCSGTFLILKKRKKKCDTALPLQNVQQNTETDCMYEEILNSDVIIATSSSSNQTPASDPNTRPENAVYATVTKQRSDSVPGHTHSANRVADTVSDYYGNITSSQQTLDNRTETIYATADLPHKVSNNEGLIYSVISHK